MSKGGPSQDRFPSLDQNIAEMRRTSTKGYDRLAEDGATKELRDGWLWRIDEDWGDGWFKKVLDQALRSSLGKEPHDWDTKLLGALEGLSRVTRNDTSLARNMIVKATNQYARSPDYRRLILKDFPSIIADARMFALQAIQDRAAKSLKTSPQVSLPANLAELRRLAKIRLDMIEAMGNQAVTLTQSQLAKGKQPAIETQDKLAKGDQTVTESQVKLETMPSSDLRDS